MQLDDIQQSTLVAIAGVLLLGCGTRNNDDIPSELINAIAAGNSSSGSDYPAGPYGSDVGEIAADICMPAWRDPSASDFDSAELEELCFSDFYDPSGESTRLLLVNTSAIWCAACRVEYGGTGERPSLGEEREERADEGFDVFGSIFQDTERNPASLEDAELWAETFQVDFAFGLDEQFAMGAFADESVQPFNMVLDTTTMEIVLVLQGDEPATLWPTVDEFLAESENAAESDDAADSEDENDE